jgi:hypothetical protein
MNMNSVEKRQLLQGLILEIPTVRTDRNRLVAWRQRCRSVLGSVFGPGCDHISALEGINFVFHGSYNIGDNNAVHTQAFHNGLEQAKHLLESCIWETQYLDNQPPQEEAPTALQRPAEPITRERSQSVDVLISWSKRQSRETATALYNWLPKVVPDFKPWMSDKDIDKGKQWFGELQGFLADATSTIICVTRENVRSPWIYYETGAIAAKKHSVRI